LHTAPPGRFKRKSPGKNEPSRETVQKMTIVKAGPIDSI